MKNVEPPRRMRAQMAIGFAYFTGITLIVGWSLPDRSVADHRAELAMRLADAVISGAAAAPAKPIPVMSGTRGKAKCAECGVIEAVRTIDTRHELMGRCDAGELGRPRINGNVYATGGNDDAESLADTVAALIADQRGIQKIAVTTRHQIVVRFRDGTSHVFDEAAPRTLRVGDRIKVIAGAARARI